MLRSGCRNSFSRSPDVSGFTAARDWPAAVSAKTKTQLADKRILGEVLVRCNVPILLWLGELGDSQGAHGRDLAKTKFHHVPDNPLVHLIITFYHVPEALAKDYLRWSRELREDLKILGLPRRAKPIQDLDAYLSEKYG